MSNTIGRALRGFLVFTFALAASLATTAPAGAGLTADATFDSDGFAQVNFASGLDAARDLAVQADGRYVLVGLSRQTTGPNTFDYLAATRLSDDGSLDTDFGTSGLVTLLPGGTPLNFGGADARAVAIQPADQKIVIAGGWNVNDGVGYHVFVTRLASNGTPDPTFGAGGSVVLDLPGVWDAIAEGIVIRGDGSILVCGGANDPSIQKGFIIRLTDAGALDTTFATGGVFAIQNPAVPQAYFSFTAVTELSGGAIVAVGDGEDLAVVKLTGTGVPDATFSGDGVANFNYTSATVGDFQVGSYENAYGLAIQNDGKILVAGSTRDPLGPQTDALVARVTTAGALDTSFGASGYAFVPNLKSDEVAYDIVLRSSGDMVVAGLDFKPVQFSPNGKMLSQYSGFYPPQALLGLSVLDDDRVVGAGEQNISGLNYQFVAIRMNATDLAEEGCDVCGEVNGDCKVTASDALAVLKMAVGSLATNLSGDMNGDGKITASDALAVLKLAVGSGTPTDACKA
ncbi:MAG: hypothetical protein HY899_15180 [Deltaproteobacteria bacterium]|nr:hypothetical protein [Deltaproteobacteria bacterium]